MIPSPIRQLDQSLASFMKYFLVYINPILHRAEYQGRIYSENQIIVVMALDLCGELRPTDLSRGLSMQKGTLTPIFRKLRELGLVERVDRPGEERSYRLRLTGAGKAFVRFLEARRLQKFHSLFSAMEPDALRAAAQGISLLTDYLKRVEEDACSRAS